jgi:hypothetical protein
MVMAVALLLTVGNGGIFGGGEVQAQTLSETCLTFLAQEGLFNVNFKCYVITGTNPAIGPVDLEDQFEPETVTVRQSQLLCEPANKTVRGTAGGAFFTACPEFHLKCYNIVPSGPPVNLPVELTDQFTSPPSIPPEDVLVEATQYLCEGATKTLLTPRK